MPTFAVCIVPHADTALYQVGSAFLGYDIRAEKHITPLLVAKYGKETVIPWIQRAQPFGLHATLGDGMDYDDDVLSEIKIRLQWIATRVTPFRLINGRFHDTFRGVPMVLSATFDSPDGTLHTLHRLVVTMINVLHSSSPFSARVDSFDDDDKQFIIRYGVPHARVLDRFDLHFTFSSGLPTQPEERVYEQLKDDIVEQTGLFQRDDHRMLTVDKICLIKKADDSRDFHIFETYPLGG